MVATSYGQKKKGSSKYIIVAPHAAGDDKRTKEIAKKIAIIMDACLVINEKYIKPENTRAKSNKEMVEDFNKLSWSSVRQQYIWDNKKPPMRSFYNDIEGFAKDIRNQREERAVIVYIHGMTNRSDNLGIDIGFGAKYDNGKLKGPSGTIGNHPESGINTGVIRAKRRDMEKLKKIMNEKLDKEHHQIKADIGRFCQAWSKENGIQYHAGTPDYSFQLEISSLLREREKIDYTSKLIADSLRAIYG